MAKTTPYHTNSMGYPPEYRDVYHDHDDCSEGQRIKRWQREFGMGYPVRKHCAECVGLDKMAMKSESFSN